MCELTDLGESEGEMPAVAAAGVRPQSLGREAWCTPGGVVLTGGAPLMPLTEGVARADSGKLPRRALLARELFLAVCPGRLSRGVAAGAVGAGGGTEEKGAEGTGSSTISEKILDLGAVLDHLTSTWWPGNGISVNPSSG